MLNVASSSRDNGWRIVRKKSIGGSVAAPIAMAMLVSQLTRPVSEAKVYS
jgi:hypothetical protein